MESVNINYGLLLSQLFNVALLLILAVILFWLYRRWSVSRAEMKQQNQEIVQTLQRIDEKLDGQTNIREGRRKI
ncbi:MAG: hypothetical protein AAF639_03720 [Chloroflexota bacterium]